MKTKTSQKILEETVRKILIENKLREDRDTWNNYQQAGIDEKMEY